MNIWEISLTKHMLSTAGDDGAVAGAVAVVREEAQAAPRAVDGDIWPDMPEEEGHPVAGRIRSVVQSDPEGEGSIEAGHLARSRVP